MTELFRLSQSSKTIGAGEYSKSIMPSPASCCCGGGGSSRLSFGECAGIRGECDTVRGECDVESGDGLADGKGCEGTRMVLRKGVAKGF